MACIEELNRYIKGWVAYYRQCSEEAVRNWKKMDAHVRRRLRAIVIRQKKRPRHLYRHLLSRDVSARKAAILQFSDDPVACASGGAFAPDSLARLAIGADGATFAIEITTAGDYAVFTQHGPDEFAMKLRAAGGEVAPTEQHAYAHSHSHDDSVTSVGLSSERPLDAKKANAWLGKLLREKGVDIFRMKGILDIAGAAERYVFQGVHMLMDGQPDRPWKPGETRRSQLVFIGRNLDRAELTAGFAACHAG